MSKNRMKNPHGHNVHQSQHTDLPQMKHETVIIPSTSTPAFSGYFLLDFKEKNCILHDIALMFNVTVNGIAGGAPYFSPSTFWNTRIEIVIQNQVVDTIYPLANWLNHQLFQQDEQRKVTNTAMGDYSNLIQRQYLTSTQSSNWIAPLWTFFNQGHIPMVQYANDLQLRVYMDSVSNLYTANGSTNTSIVMNSCQLLAQLSRISNTHADKIHREIRASPNHYKFLETRQGIFTVPANTSASGFQTNIVLTPIVGRVSFLYFVVRPSSGLTGENAWKFTPITSFSILDSTGTNITGGQAVPSALALNLLNKDNALSTYLTENFAGQGVASNNANMYMYSFSASAHTSAKDGVSLNYYNFRGNEQLQILFPGTLPQSQVDVYAFTEAVLELNASGVKKIAL